MHLTATKVHLFFNIYMMKTTILFWCEFAAMSPIYHEDYLCNWVKNSSSPSLIGRMFGVLVYGI
ncbi:4893_t:CDS:2 [Entrophospora sp. SA101]|nr:4893_t:CDS:2 [Entrophospora sp. SA101]